MMADSSASAASSVAGAGRSSGRSSRIDCGTACEIRVSREVTPKVASIDLMSALPGPTCRSPKVRFASLIVISCGREFPSGSIRALPL